MAEEIDEDAAWEAAHAADEDAEWEAGRSSSDEEQFGTAALKQRQQAEEDRMWEEINQEFDFTQDRVEDFALKSLTIAEQNFGFRVPDPDLDYTEEFNGSVKQAQHEIETGRVEIPDEGIFIKSARLTKSRGSDVYFKLQHVKSTADDEKPMQVVDDLQAGYLNILAVFRQVKLVNVKTAVAKEQQANSEKYGGALAYAETIVSGVEAMVQKLERLLQEVRSCITDYKKGMMHLEQQSPALALQHVTQRRLLAMSIAHRLVIAIRSLALAFVTAAVVTRPALEYFGGRALTSLESQFYYFLGEIAKVVNNQKRLAHKQNAPEELLGEVDALHIVFAKDFQALRVELDLASRAGRLNSRVMWAQHLAGATDLGVRCSLYPTVVGALAAYQKQSSQSADRRVAALFELPATIKTHQCRSLSLAAVRVLTSTTSQKPILRCVFVAGPWLVITNTESAHPDGPILLLNVGGGASVATCHEASAYPLVAAGFKVVDVSAGTADADTEFDAAHLADFTRLSEAEQERSLLVQGTGVGGAPASAVTISLKDAAAVRTFIDSLCSAADEAAHHVPPESGEMASHAEGAEYEVVIPAGQSLTLFLGGGEEKEGQSGQFHPIVVEDKAQLTKAMAKVALGDVVIGLNDTRLDDGKTGLQEVSQALIDLQSSDRVLAFRRARALPVPSASFRAPHQGHSLFKTQVSKVLSVKASDEDGASLSQKEIQQEIFNQHLQDFTDLCNGRVQNLTALVQAGVLTLPPEGAAVKKVSSAGTSVYRVAVDPKSLAAGPVFEDMVQRAARIAAARFNAEATVNARPESDSLQLLQQVFQRIGLRMYTYDPCTRSCSALELLEPEAFFRATGHLATRSGAFPIQNSKLLNATPDEVEQLLQNPAACAGSQVDEGWQQLQWIEMCSEVFYDAGDGAGGGAWSPRPRRGSTNECTRSFWWLRERELLMAHPGSGTGMSSPQCV